MSNKQEGKSSRDSKICRLIDFKPISQLIPQSPPPEVKQLWQQMQKESHKEKTSQELFKFVDESKHKHNYRLTNEEHLNISTNQQQISRSFISARQKSFDKRQLEEEYKRKYDEKCESYEILKNKYKEGEVQYTNMQQKCMYLQREVLFLQKQLSQKQQFHKQRSKTVTDLASSKKNVPIIKINLNSFGNNLNQNIKGKNKEISEEEINSRKDQNVTSSFEDLFKTMTKEKKQLKKKSENIVSLESQLQNYEGQIQFYQKKISALEKQLSNQNKDKNKEIQKDKNKWKQLNNNSDLDNIQKFKQQVLIKENIIEQNYKTSYELTQEILKLKHELQKLHKIERQNEELHQEIQEMSSKLIHQIQTNEDEEIHSQNQQNSKLFQSHYIGFNKAYSFGKEDKIKSSSERSTAKKNRDNQHQEYLQKQIQRLKNQVLYKNLLINQFEKKKNQTHNAVLEKHLELSKVQIKKISDSFTKINRQFKSAIFDLKKENQEMKEKQKYFKKEIEKLYKIIDSKNDELNSIYEQWSESRKLFLKDEEHLSHGQNEFHKKQYGSDIKKLLKQRRDNIYIQNQQ